MRLVRNKSTHIFWLVVSVTILIVSCGDISSALKGADDGSSSKLSGFDESRAPATCDALPKGHACPMYATAFTDACLDSGFEILYCEGCKFLCSGKPGASAKASPYHIECVAERYDGKAWSELGKFQSPNDPHANNGELLQNAEFVSGTVAFSATGDFDAGLMSFGSIYDNEQRIGTQVQKGQGQAMNVTLSQGESQYSLHCEMVKN